MRRDYAAAIRRLHDLGVMINGSFVFGMDGDDRVGVRADGRVGHRARHRDGDVSHPHAVPGHGALPPHRGSGPAHGARLGSCTTRVTRCSGRRECRARSSRAATGGPIASSTAGDRLRAAPPRTPIGSRACATWHTRPAGRSSSRCGTPLLLDPREAHRMDAAGCSSPFLTPARIRPGGRSGLFGWSARRTWTLSTVEFAVDWKTLKRLEARALQQQNFWRARRPRDPLRQPDLVVDFAALVSRATVPLLHAREAAETERQSIDRLDLGAHQLV